MKVIFQNKLGVPFSYLKWIVKTKKYIYDNDVTKQENFKNTYHFMSASISHLLPSLSKKNHINFYKGVKWNQVWAAHDQGCFFLLNSTKIIDKNDILNKAAKNKGYIFCTFHVGSYRLINFILAQNNIRFSLVTDKQFIDIQGEKAITLLKRFEYEFLLKKNIETLEILNAENSQIVLQAIRRLRSGKSLLFYIDGNTGVGGYYADMDKLIKINFFNNDLYARKGIAFLSHFTQTPIIPVICIRTGWLSREIHFLNPIKPNKETNKEKYNKKVTQLIYSNLEKYVNKYPEQWEGWLYVHKFLDTEKFKKNPEFNISKKNNKSFNVNHKLILDKDRFAVLTYSNKDLLFDKQSFQLFPISNQFKETLSVFRKPAKISELKACSLNVKENAIKELFEMNILINA